TCRNSLRRFSSRWSQRMAQTKNRSKKKAPAKVRKASRATSTNDVSPHSGEIAAEAHSAPSAEGCYVYGVIEADSPLVFGRIGIGGAGESVYTIHYQDIAAVVSRTPIFIFDPTRENALAHEHVVESVMKSNTVIPMGFGTVFRTEDDVRQVLRSIYRSL